MDEERAIWGHSYYHPNSAIAQQIFTLHPKPKPLYTVTVTAACVTCVPEGFSPYETERRTLQYGFRDIIGCDCLKGKDDTDTCAYLVIYAYPHRKKLTSRKTSRRRETVTLTFDHKGTYAENQAAANAWRVMIKALLEGIHLRNISGESCVLVGEGGGSL